MFSKGFVRYVTITWKCCFNLFCTFARMKNNDKLPVESEKYKLIRQKGSIILHIKNLNISDTANYTLVASNKDVTKNVTYDIRKKG